MLEPVDRKNRPLVKALATQGYLLHQLHSAYSRNAKKAIGWILYFFLREVPAATSPGSVHNSQAGYQLFLNWFSDPASSKGGVEEFVNVLDSESRLDLLFRILDSAPSSKRWIAACIAELADSPSIVNIFDLESLVGRAVFLRSTVDSGVRSGGVVDRLVKTLLEKNGLLDSVMRGAFDPKVAWLYSAMARAGAVESRAFVTWCEAGLAATNAGTWLEEMEKEGDLFELVINILENGEAIHLGIAYFDALVDHAQKMASGSVHVEYFSDSWSLVVQPLATHARETFRDRLLEIAKVSGGHTSAEFFARYGDAIADPAVLSSDGKTVMNLIDPLIESENERGIAWLAGLFRKHGNFLSSYKPEHAVRVLRERIESIEFQKLEGKQLGDDLRAIASVLEVEVKRKDPDEK